MSAHLKASALAALAGNLWTSNDVGTRVEDALMHVAAAQLKAIAIAVLFEETPDGSPDNWVMQNSLSRAEASAAISGIATMLATARSILTETEEHETEAPAESEAANG